MIQLSRNQTDCDLLEYDHFVLEEQNLQRLNLGEADLTILSDGTYEADGGAMFGVVPKVLWEKRIKADERNMLKMGLNSLLFRDGKRTVLIETGIGPKLSEKNQAIHKNQALLMNSMKEAGISPDEVDIVINTHLHFDHCGWNTFYQDGKPEPTFPNAVYYVQEGELEHAHEQHERDRVSYLTDNYDPLVRSGQMRLLRGKADIVKGITVEVFPGHTRHLQVVTVQVGGAVVCYPSDLVPTSHHLDPTWVLGYDLFPLESIDSRHRFYRRAIPEKWLVVFTHDHETPWAYLEIGERGRPLARALEVDWQQQVTPFRST
jgi:glyoxylase-like metal-dependent hydrolase (beta-lactamase superfamily II)